MTLRARARDARRRAKDLEARAGRRLEAERARRGWLRTLVLAYEADRNRGGALLAGGLAYRIFLWEIPAVLFVLSLAGAVLSASGRPVALTIRGTGVTGALAETLASAVNDTARARWLLLLAGLVLMLWAGRGAARALWLVGEIAWQHRAPRRPSGLRAAVVFSTIVLVGLGVPFAGSAWIEGPFAVDVLGWILTTIAFAAITLAGVALLPRGGRPWTAIGPGVGVFVIGIRLLMLFSGLYVGVRLRSVDNLYGALGVAVAIQLWLYLVARLYVASQFLNATVAGVPTGRLGGLDAPLADDA